MLLIAVVVGVMAFLTLGATSGQAAHKKLGLTNRVAPSGVVSVDPTAVARLPKGVTAPKGTPPVPGPGTVGCSDASGTNVRVNQDCTNQSAAGFVGRSSSQNETGVAVNPTNPMNIVASQNDYRRGDGNCGVDWSMDGGQTWGSQTAPMNFALPILDNGGARHYWTSGGDTSVAFDSSGEAYLMCQVFDRGFPTDERGPLAPFGASAFVLFRSADGGASWSFPGSYVTFSTDTEGEVQSDVGLLDKEYMAIDSNPDSPFVDRIYVAWANYDAAFTKSPSFLSYSDDHGNSWSTPAEISGKSEELCPITFSSATDFSCDESQFNQPFVGPDGTVYDLFVNSNNCAGALRSLGFDCPNGPDGDNHNQILLVKSTDGGVTWSDPVKVSDYFELPDCYTYTGFDFGRACVPTAPLSGVSIFRAANYPVGMAADASDIKVTFGSYINRHSNWTSKKNCTPDGISTLTFLNLFDGVGDSNGCNNDIVLSTSTDGGATFTGGSTPVFDLPSVSTERGGHLADQWWQWSAGAPDGTLVTAYYDRKYGSDMSTGFMDISLKAAGAPSVRVNDVSFPSGNDFPDLNGFSDFFGDYNALAIGSDGVAHPVWMDNRNPIYTFDSTPGADPRTLKFAGYGADIYTAAVAGDQYLPKG